MESRFGRNELRGMLLVLYSHRKTLISFQLYDSKGFSLGTFSAKADHWEFKFSHMQDESAPVIEGVIVSAAILHRHLGLRR